MLLDEYLKMERTSRKKIIEIFASGPSVSIAKRLSINSFKIAIGDMPWRAPELGPFDVWVTNNTYYPLPWKYSHLKKIRKSKAITLISSQSVNHHYEKNQLNRILVKLRKLKNDKKIVFYDCAHFHESINTHPKNNCCEFVKHLQISSNIQKYFSESTGKLLKESDYRICHGTTNAILLAIALKCEIIYVHGVELPRTMGEYKHYKNWKIPTGSLKLRAIIYYQQFINRNLKTDFTNEARAIILEQFKLLGRISIQLGKKIYVTNKNSPLLKLQGYEYLDVTL